MSDSTLFIHVGPGKTATTFLQDVVLTGVSSVESLIKPTVNFGGEKVRFGDLFNFPPDVWDSSGGDAFSRLVQNRTQAGNLIISDENVFGGLASPQPWIPDPTREMGPLVRLCRQTNGKTDTYSMAAHLRKLSEVASNWGFANVKVLAVTRRQDTRLASGYAQVSDRVLGAGQEGFETWVRHLTQSPIGYYLGGGIKLDYWTWYQEIEAAVGEGNTYLLPFELLKKSRSRFIRQFLDLLEIEKTDVDRLLQDLGPSDDQKRNVSSRTGSVWSLRKPVGTGPRLRPTRMWKALGFPARLPMRWPDLSREDSIRLTPGLSQEILDVYGHGNRHLNNRFPELELGTYSYYQ
jgi:hypothetical protein